MPHLLNEKSWCLICGATWEAAPPSGFPEPKVHKLRKAHVTGHRNDEVRLFMVQLQSA